MTPKLNEALSKFQAAVGPVPKNRTVNTGKFSYKYADISDLIEISAKLFAEHGLSITQGGVYRDGIWQFITKLGHSSGESLEYAVPMRAPSADPKLDGAWFTYYRRYGVAAILFIASDDDTDSEGSAPAKDKDKAPPPKPPNPFTRPGGPPKDPIGDLGKAVADRSASKFATPKVSEAQIKRLFAIASANGYSQDQVKGLLAAEGIESSKELNREQYERVCAQIEGKK